MRQQLDRTRLFISTWYTGAGSLKSVFTRRPEHPFSKIKQISGEELERLKPRQNSAPIKIHELTEAEKTFIRRRARTEWRKWYRTRLLILLFAILLTSLLVYMLYHFVLLKLI